MEAIHDLRARVNDGLIRKYDKVVGTGVGHKFVNGRDTGQPALLVFVIEKDHALRALSASDQLVPPDLEGITTDVIEVGHLVKHGYTQRIRPIAPGYSAGHGNVTAGTIGGIFLDRDGSVVALSNNHVFANEGACQLGDLIYQPSRADSPTSGQVFTGWEHVPDTPYFATLKDYYKLSFKEGKNEQDSAIALINEKYLSTQMVSPNFPLGQPLGGFADAKVGMKVQKFGRTTGHTTGTILGLGSEFTVGYDHGPATFVGCMVTTPMSRGGDSGSLLLDERMNAVGLLFGGSDKVSIHIPIQTVANRYGLRPWTADVRPIDQYWGYNWRREYYDHTSKFQPEWWTLVACSNQHGYIETDLGKQPRDVALEVFTGDDQGSGWGPGLAVVHPQGTCKVNVRYREGFGGWNGQEIKGVGVSQPAHWYQLRIRYDGDRVIGQAFNGLTMHTVWETSLAKLGGPPLAIRVGKTDVSGGNGDHGLAGAQSRTQYRNLIVN